MSANPISRRTAILAPFLQLGRKSPRHVDGGFVLDAFPLGHRLRDHQPFPAAREERKVPLVIVGSGMAGLSAAWWLRRKGFGEYVLLEMEPTPGGNSRYGENSISAYPWGAHYVPIPNRKSPLVRELFTELGLLSAGGEWNERHLCHSPQERLYLHGRWQYNLEPEIALSNRGREQFKRFDEQVRQRHETGQWTIPHDLGKIDGRLEAIPFPAWLKEQGFDASELLWYLDYSTRDDYGTSLAETSAWAGLHYFAARDHDDKGPFTWPEGNGYLLRHLRQLAGDRIKTDEPVYRVARRGRAWEVHTPKVRYLAEAVIWAAPTFFASYVVEGAPKAAGFTYSPWVTANLTLTRQPQDAPGAELAWDNVFYGSPSLGYVVATHQHLGRRREESVWTWYYAMAEMSPAAARRQLLDASWESWRDRIFADLARAHPDIADCVTRIDIFRNGHAMIRPTAGFLASDSRKQFLRTGDGLAFANSDLSGISIFEEAQHRGVAAAEAILRRLQRA